MTYDEMIEILQAAKAGKVIEWQNQAGEWERWLFSSFNFMQNKYRVKPEPKRCWVFWKNDKPMFCADHAIEGYIEMEVVR